VVDEDTEPIPADWMKRYFDLKKSDPAALVVLQHQLAARQGPHVAKFLDLPISTSACANKRSPTLLPA
jgi:hypothetical protein